MKENNRECFTEIGSLTEAMKVQDALAAAIQSDRLLHFPPGEYHF